MMERVWNLLKDWYWKIDQSKFQLSNVELDFLSNFFMIEEVIEIDELSSEEKSYLVLRKKPKYIMH